MAITKITTPSKYIGLSTDTKPKEATHSPVRSGSTFYEYDTDLMYITYDDGTNWVEKSADVTTDTIIDNLKDLNDTLEETLLELRRIARIGELTLGAEVRR